MCDSDVKLTDLERNIVNLCEIFNNYACADDDKKKSVCKSGVNTLSKSEVKTLMTEQLPQFLKAVKGTAGEQKLLDLDGDGEIDFKEFMITVSCLACCFMACCPKK